MSANTLDKQPCRYCGEPTRQRAEGIPYCSMDCINEKRRRRDNNVLECPYPDCGWDTVYDPENGLSRAVAYHDIDEHRELHKKQLSSAETAPSRTDSGGAE